VWPAVVSTVPPAEFPAGLSLCQGRFLADALAGSLPLSGLAGLLPSSLIITGDLYIAIRIPFMNMFVFNHFHVSTNLAILNSGSNKVFFIPKTVEQSFSTLAGWAIVRATACHQDPLDRRLALSARQPRPQVDAVFQLKESPHPISVHIIAY
jgi:hypothetical protein